MANQDCTPLHLTSEASAWTSDYTKYTDKQKLPRWPDKQTNQRANTHLAPFLNRLEDAPAVFPILGVASQAPQHEEGLHGFRAHEVDVHAAAHASPLMEGHILW